MASFAITFLFLLFLVNATFAVNFSLWSDEELHHLHKVWMAENGRSYRTLSEEESRFKIFKDNLRYIDERNAAAERGEHTFWLGLTPFTDLTNEEYQRTYLNLQTPDLAATETSSRYLPLATDNLPSSVDWRKAGVVAAVKNQGRCGSCWAFSAASTIESINAIDTGRLITLSEQQLVDCDSSNNGCNGGWMQKAFRFVIRNGGIASAKDYPYTAKKGNCRSVNSVVSIDSYEHVPSNNEQAMKKAVANQPITVAIGSNSSDFQHYKSGIFVGNCPTRIDHAVVIVGYDTKDQKDYWIVRNSWGSNWGENGYIRMVRNSASSQGICGIAQYPSYPIKWGYKQEYLAMPEDRSKSIA